MNIREEIIKQLDKPIELSDIAYHEASLLEDGTYGVGFTYTSRYKLLKDCLIYKDGSEWDLDLWFKGIINSLYYRPNKYVLVLEGKYTSVYNMFLSRMFEPNKCQFIDSGEGSIYDALIICKNFYKNELNIPMEDNFVVNKEISKLHFEYESPEDFANNLMKVTGFSSCDKRLASYCSTTNKWQHPPRKNFIVLKLESINQELFNSIDKLQLWIEIFNKFKPQL